MACVSKTYSQQEQQ